MLTTLFISLFGYSISITLRLWTSVGSNLETTVTWTHNFTHHDLWLSTGGKWRKVERYFKKMHVWGFYHAPVFEEHFAIPFGSYKRQKELSSPAQKHCHDVFFDIEFR